MAQPQTTHYLWPEPCQAFGLVRFECLPIAQLLFSSCRDVRTRYKAMQLLFAIDKRNAIEIIIANSLRASFALATV
jgi:hypothetical protein